jgi:hypothetical protein
VVARRQLKQEAAHPLAQNVGEEAKIPNERLSALEPSYMGDEFTDFDSVNKLFLAGLTPPGLNVGNRWPRVKGCVDFDGVEALQVVLEPIFL